VREKRTLVAIVITAAAWATAAHGGDFNACRVTYDYDGTLLINGERFFPVGTHFLPPGEPDQTPAPSIEDAYAAYAANGGNILFAPRYFNMYSPFAPVYDVHLLPSDMFSGQADCVGHLNGANAAGVKLMTCPHINWWWDKSYNPPGPHPLWITVQADWGWHIEQATQEERFSGLDPNGGIKGWIENGASEAFMGWHHFTEPAWSFYNDRWFTEPPEYPKPPTPVPTAAGMQETYGWLRALEDDPAVDAEHPTLYYEPVVVRTHDLLPGYFDAAELVCVNPIMVPEPYVADFWDNEHYTTKGGILPNYHSAAVGDVIDVFFEVGNGAKSIISMSQNHYFGVPGKPGVNPTEAQQRFMAYDAIIHRANGVLFGHQSFGTINGETGRWEIFDDYWDPCKPTFNEIGQGSLMHGVLKGEYDNILAEVETRPLGGGDVIEKSVFIGGELAPKNHYLSDQILMEGCAKRYGGYTYLIVARREGIDQYQPSFTPVEVTFRPYFSSKSPWTGTVEVVGEEGPGGVRTINIINGGFTDQFVQEEVHIYKFVRPAPYVGE